MHFFDFIHLIIVEVTKFFQMPQNFFSKYLILFDTFDLFYILYHSNIDTLAVNTKANL